MIRRRPCLVHGLDGAPRSKALSSQESGAFFFSRAATRVCSSSPSVSGATGEFFLVDINGAAAARQVRVAHSLEMWFGREAADRSRITLAYLHSTESRFALTLALGAADRGCWLVHELQGISMITAALLNSHCQGRSVASRQADACSWSRRSWAVNAAVPVTHVT